MDGYSKAQKIGFNILSFLLIFLLEAAFLLPDAIGASNDCPKEIKGYWKLDETATGLYEDTIGANDGTCSGAACPGNTTGTVGNGKSFSGINEISIGADASFDWTAGQSFTIELWVHRDTGTVAGGSGFEAFIGRVDVDLSWYIGINASGDAQAQLTASDGSGPGVLTGSKDLRSSSSDPTWHHVALVRYAGTNTNTLYVDGELSASQTHSYTAGFNSATAPMTLGALDGSNDFDNGGLDEVAIYGQALDQDEIKRHYYIARGYCSQYDSAIKVMPMGDSITAGAWAYGIPVDSQRIGYRLDLWEQLEADLYWSDFVGSEDQHGGDFTFDVDHAGFPGITASELEELLRTGTNPTDSLVITPGAYLATHPAEVILLHIGTNNPVSNADIVRDILDEIDAFSKNTTVVLAQIIKQSTDPVTFTSNPVVESFNIALQGLAQTRIDQGDKIILVDMENGVLDYAFDDTSPYNSGDMYDRRHPNPVGYPKMADKWYSTLATILPQSELPDITSTAVTAAVKDQAYTYSVTATGPPSPIFDLINSVPSGMTINSATGEFHWTPTTTGDFDVTVEARNWVGVATQSFTITVNPPPPPNAAPAIITTAPTEAEEGILYTYAAAATDPDAGDTLTWSLTNALAGMTVVAATGVVSWTPAIGSAGDASYTLTVTDGTDTDSEAVTVTVAPASPSPVSSSGGGGGGGCFIDSLD